MRIVIITSSLEPGGAQRVISNLILAWSNCGIESHLILLEKKERFYSIPPSVPIIEIGRKSNNVFLNKLRVLNAVRKNVKRIRPDVVLSMPEEIGIWIIGALLGTGFPVVVSERNNPWKMPYKKVTRLCRKVLYPFAKGYIFQSEKASSFFSKKIQAKGVVLDNPLDLSKIPDVYHGTRNNAFLFAGRLEEQKNPELLIRGFSVFNKRVPGYKLLIFGEGSLKNNLAKLITELELDENVFLKGLCTDLFKQNADAKGFIMTSNYEGVPNSLIEAIASGIPSISTNFDPAGPKSVFQHESSMITIIPKNDCLALSESLEHLAKMGVNEMDYSVSENVKERFSSKSVSQQWLNYLVKVSYDCKKK